MSMKKPPAKAPGSPLNAIALEIEKMHKMPGKGSPQAAPQQHAQPPGCPHCGQPMPPQAPQGPIQQ